MTSSTFAPPASGSVDRARETAPPVRLTDREREIVRLVAEGLTNGEIGGWLFLSPRTVQSHVATAMEKLASPSRTGLAVAAIRRGLIPLHPAADRDRPPTNG